MTNPAEKIRQVVEEHTFALTGSELFKGGKRTHLCHLVTAQEYMRYMAEKLLDVIIAEMEEEYIYLTEACMVSPPEQDKHSGYLACLRNKIEQLKEARSELLQQQ